MFFRQYQRFTIYVPEADIRINKFITFVQTPIFSNILNSVSFYHSS